MLRVILSRLKAEAGKLLAEEQAGFGPGRSTAGQIFNSRVITETSTPTRICETDRASPHKYNPVI